MKATAKAPANIALIKFWGKKDKALVLPMNNSISLNLSDAYTVTTVEFDEAITADKVELDGLVLDGDEKERIVKHLERIRKLAGITIKAKVTTENNFPRGAGIASSASGFAALTLAGVTAAGLKLTEKEISVLARLGSGSACRSVPDGWVEWKEAETSEDSYAYLLHEPEFWNIYDVVAIVATERKKIGSTEGHAAAESSPFYLPRIAGMKQKVREIKKAISERDFRKMGEIVEAEAINMHAVMMTSNPPLLYWNGVTVEIMQSIRQWREEGLKAYFTIDAGSNVHIICEGGGLDMLEDKLRKMAGVKEVIVNRVARGVHLI